MNRDVNETLSGTEAIGIKVKIVGNDKGISGDSVNERSNKVSDFIGKIYSRYKEVQNGK